MRILTFDIGGANIKRLLYDSSQGSVESDIFYFPIWQRKKELMDFLRGMSVGAGAVGVTMTAELCDAFEDRREGVEYIVDACEHALDKPRYLTRDGRLIGKDDIENPLELAASNWTASRYLLEKKYGEGILVDVGSTTTDIVPFGAGAEVEKTDLRRLQRGQLVYTGFLRTPVSAVVRRVPYKGELTRIASEYFGITADVYNVLGMLNDYSCAPPDGRGKARVDSLRRLARHLCSSPDELGEEEITLLCEHVYREQSREIAGALEEVIASFGRRPAYICGVGSVLGARACEIACLDTIALSSLIPAHDNLPSLGLADMLGAKV